MPRGYWDAAPAPNPFGGPQTRRVWVNDPNGPEYRFPLLEILTGGCLGYIALLIVVGVLLTGAYFWVQKNYVPPIEFVSGSAWHGPMYQYGDYVGQNPTAMKLNVNTVLKDGSFTATVQQPDLNTITRVKGNEVTDTSDDRWKYVINPEKTVHLEFTQCTKNAVYLQFTETANVKGNSTLLNASFYAIACSGEISGVWFLPDKPNAGPGGEFDLSKE